MKLIKQKISYYDQQGVERQGFNFYVQDNGLIVAVKPSFKSDYRLLTALAESYEDNN